MIEGSGSAPLTNRSGSRRHKNIRIPIRNTASKAQEGRKKPVLFLPFPPRAGQGSPCHPAHTPSTYGSPLPPWKIKKLWYRTALQGKSHLSILFLGIAQPQSQLPHSCACKRIMYPRIGPHIFLQQNRQIDCGNIKIAHTHMNVEIRTVAAPFLFQEYLFRIFGIVILQ